MKQQVEPEIGDVNQAASNRNAKIADVSTDVGGREDQPGLDPGRPAEDHQRSEIDARRSGRAERPDRHQRQRTPALKLRGERNYIDVKLGKTKQPVRFGDITLLLKSVDHKKNRYTVEVMADDKVTQKDDKSINEPVQFYTVKGGHIPYELVINTVGKNEIVGYLSTPKVEATR